MIDSKTAYKNIIALIESARSDYKLFTHRAALSYDDLEQVKTEAGFVGTEGKCMVLKSENGFILYITLFNRRISFDKMKESLHIKKIRLASKEELKESFGAEPGCAYPFGFESTIPIYVDPVVYDQEWFLFSPAVPDTTVQIRGSDMKQIFALLDNPVTEVSTFNILEL